MVSPVKAYLLLKDFSKWSGHDAVHITRAHNRLVLVPSSAPKIFLFVGLKVFFTCPVPSVPHFHSECR
jgi:hypothetical protein